MAELQNFVLARHPKHAEIVKTTAPKQYIVKCQRGGDLQEYPDQPGARHNHWCVFDKVQLTPP